VRDCIAATYSVVLTCGTGGQRALWPAPGSRGSARLYLVIPAIALRVEVMKFD
jgi:hypothetical protein